LLAVKLVLAGLMLSSESPAASAVVAARPARAVATAAATANFLAVRIMIGFLLFEMGLRAPVRSMGKGLGNGLAALRPADGKWPCVVTCAGRSAGTGYSPFPGHPAGRVAPCRATSGDR
jgi:hypothetical protein